MGQYVYIVISEDADPAYVVGVFSSLSTLWDCVKNRKDQQLINVEQFEIDNTSDLSRQWNLEELIQTLEFKLAVGKVTLN